MSKGPTINFRYRNHRGQTDLRTVTVDAVEFLSHPGFNYQPGWFVSGYDHDKKARRSFALTHIVMEPIPPSFQLILYTEVM